MQLLNPAKDNTYHEITLTKILDDIYAHITKMICIIYIAQPQAHFTVFGLIKLNTLGHKF